MLLHFGFFCVRLVDFAVNFFVHTNTSDSLEDCLQNDLLCVQWDVKPYSLTRRTWDFSMAAVLIDTSSVRVRVTCEFYLYEHFVILSNPYEVKNTKSVLI